MHFQSSISVKKCWKKIFALEGYFSKSDYLASKNRTELIFALSDRESSKVCYVPPFITLGHLPTRADQSQTFKCDYLENMFLALSILCNSQVHMYVGKSGNYEL